MNNGRHPRTADLAIIGAGLAGVGTAYYATRRGVTPVVLDKGDVGGEQSTRAWGYVRQQGRDPLELPLMMASNALWRDLESELDADLDWCMSGNLGIARDADELAAYRRWLALGEDHGLDTRLVSASEVRELLPGIRGEWAGGLLTPSDGHASPPKTTAAFATAARRLGASIETGCAALSIDVRGGRVQGVHTEHGYIATERVVCAAGAWSSRLLRPLGIHLPQLRLRASVGMTGPAAPLVPVAAWTPEIAFRQRPDGVVVLARFDQADHDLTMGSVLQARYFTPGFRDRRERVRFHLGMAFLRDLADRVLPRGVGADPARRWAVRSPPINRRSAEYALTKLRQLFAGAGELRIEERWSCYVDLTPDLLPALGPVPGCEGLTIATGFSGHGFAMAPIVGKVSADAALGEDHGFALNAFSVRRWQT